MIYPTRDYRIPAMVVGAVLACRLVLAQTPPEADEPMQHRHHEEQEGDDLPPGIPPITDEDRRAAFPDVDGHHVHDNAINYFVLLDQLEWQSGGGDSAVSWENIGWVGRDKDRFWFRTEGEAEDGSFAEAEAHLLYGRAISRWWNVVAGVRHDFQPGPSRTWAAFGFQGLAPYWFEIEATGYVEGSGRTQFRFEAEYDLLLTNRLVLQPLFETDIFGKSDIERGIGAGLSTIETGLRLRYEFRREVAPYVGVAWSWKFFETADLAEASGDDTNGVRFLIGFRTWF